MPKGGSEMSTEQHPFLRCKNICCHQSIWVSAFSPLASATRELSSGRQFFENYVCPACDHAYDYRPSSVTWAQPSPDDKKQILGIYEISLESACEEQDCDAAVRIRRPMVGPRDDQRFLRDSSSWTLGDVRCSRGHRL